MTNISVGPIPKEKYKLKEDMKCSQCFCVFNLGDWAYVCYDGGKFACSYDCEAKMTKDVPCVSLLFMNGRHDHIKVNFVQ